MNAKIKITVDERGGAVVDVDGQRLNGVRGVILNLRPFACHDVTILLRGELDFEAENIPVSLLKHWSPEPDPAPDERPKATIISGKPRQ